MSVSQQKTNLTTVKRPSVSAVNKTKTRYGDDRKLYAEGGDVMATKSAGMPPWMGKTAVKGKDMGKKGTDPKGTPKGMAPPFGKATGSKKMASGGMVSRGWGAARKGC